MDASRRGRIGRRRTLGVIAVGTALSIAGCIGGAPGDGGGESGGDGGADDHTPLFRGIDDHPVDEPVPIEDDHLCEVCGMHVADYPAWMGQLAHDDGTGVFFDTPGCLFAYYAVPTHFGGPETPVASAWTTEYDTTDRIDALDAWYVLEREGDGAEEPMDPNPRPFAEEDDALAYANGAEELSEADVIELEQVDEAIARLYRAPRLP